MGFCGKIGHYLSETNHPLVQFFYFFIGPVCYLLYLKFIYLDKFVFVGTIPFIIGNLFAFLGFYNYYMSCKVDPGTITHDNVKHVIEHFKGHYDNRTFVENHECTTCKLIKSAYQTCSLETLSHLQQVCQPLRPPLSMVL